MSTFLAQPEAACNGESVKAGVKPPRSGPEPKQRSLDGLLSGRHSKTLGYPVRERYE